MLRTGQYNNHLSILTPCLTSSFNSILTPEFKYADRLILPSELDAESFGGFHQQPLRIYEVLGFDGFFQRHRHDIGVLVGHHLPIA